MLVVAARQHDDRLQPERDRRSARSLGSHAGRDGDTDDPAVVPLSFSASPGGKGRTTFDWLRGERPGVTFVNLSNDYPQRIRYWREGSDLLAEISLADGSKARRWRYRPKPSPPPPQAP